MKFPFTLAALTLAAAFPASAQLPLIGGSYLQSVRLVVTAGLLLPASPGERCVAEARLLQRNLRPAAERVLDLRPGESGWIEVNLGSLTGFFGRRAELLPAVRVLAGQCAVSLEIIENLTGRTTAQINYGLLLPAAPSIHAIRLLPTGASLGQVIRLGAIRGFDPQPDPPGCRAILAFADAQGNPAGPTKAIDLAPGGSDFLDLDAGLLLPAAGDPLRARRFVRPRLLLPAAGGGDTRGCALSVQVFEQLGGATANAYAAQ